MAALALSGAGGPVGMAASLPATGAPLDEPQPHVASSSAPVYREKRLGPRPPRIVLAVRTERPLVALTFDLDMSPQMAAALRARVVQSWVNQEALDLLEATGTHATLFMTGLWAELYPDLARQLAGRTQFEIGNHSYSHPAFHLPCYQLRGVGPGEAAAELERSQEVISRITGVKPRYFRFPGGCFDRAALDAVHTADLIPVQWSVNSVDAFNPSAQQIARTVLAQVRPGAIVVMHLMGGPNAPATGQALRLIIPALAQRGYEFVTVGELLDANPAVEPNYPREVVEARQLPRRGLR